MRDSGLHTVIRLFLEKGGDFQESGCHLFSTLIWAYLALGVFSYQLE